MPIVFVPSHDAHMCVVLSNETNFGRAILLSKTLCDAEVIWSFHTQQMQTHKLILFIPLNGEIVAFIFIMIFSFSDFFSISKCLSRFSFDYFVVFESSLAINSTPFTLCIQWWKIWTGRKMKRSREREKRNDFRG